MHDIKCSRWSLADGNCHRVARFVVTYYLMNDDESLAHAYNPNELAGVCQARLCMEHRQEIEDQHEVWEIELIDSRLKHFE